MSIGVIPKPHLSDLCLVTDHSASKHMLNNFIACTDASIKLDRLQVFGTTLHTVLTCHGHPPAWLFKSEIAAAYHRIPMHLLWKIKQISTFEGLQHVDHNMAFRSHTMPRSWCTFFVWVMWIAGNVVCHLYLCMCGSYALHG